MTCCRRSEQLRLMRTVRCLGHPKTVPTQAAIASTLDRTPSTIRTPSTPYRRVDQSMLTIERGMAVSLRPYQGRSSARNWWRIYAGARPHAATRAKQCLDGLAICVRRVVLSDIGPLADNQRDACPPGVVAPPSLQLSNAERGIPSTACRQQNAGSCPKRKCGLQSPRRCDRSSHSPSLVPSVKPSG
jgi:hypothetical protein